MSTNAANASQSSSNTTLNRSGANASMMMDEDSIYMLPKTYNGKTVTELFPEFKYDSVLRFSKLFGVGRVTSLPKIWKGTRKRKKTTRSDSINRSLSTANDDQLRPSDSAILHPIPEEGPLNSSEVAANNQQPPIADDVFRLFEEDFR